MEISDTKDKYSKTGWLYKRRVIYHETDQMGIVHHSNYIRFLEEARTEQLRSLGVSYRDIEAMGVMIPVTGAVCEYKSPARFDDILEIYVRPSFFNGVRMEFVYTIYLEGTDTLVFYGRTSHCFIDAKERYPVNLKKRLPEICGIIKDSM